MNDQFDCLEILKNMASLISQLLGTAAEVVIHDIKTGEIIWIANGELTGRKVGKTTDNFAIRVFAEQKQNLDENNCVVGYLSTKKSIHPLRVSNLFVNNTKGELRYALCINQDITQFRDMQNFLNTFIGITEEGATTELSPQSVEDMATVLIQEEVARPSPYPKESKEEKLAILKRLDEKNVFDLRRVVPKVCDSLHISQATLYNYLRELRRGDAALRAAPDESTDSTV